MLLYIHVENKYDNMFYETILTDVYCKHRRHISCGEPALHPDHGPVPPTPPADVERLARIKAGSLWMPTH